MTTFRFHNPWLLTLLIPLIVGAILNSAAATAGRAVLKHRFAA